MATEVPANDPATEPVHDTSERLNTSVYQSLGRRKRTESLHVVLVTGGHHPFEIALARAVILGNGSASQ